LKKTKTTRSCYWLFRARFENYKTFLSLPGGQLRASWRRKISTLFGAWVCRTFILECSFLRNKICNHARITFDLASDKMRSRGIRTIHASRRLCRTKGILVSPPAHVSSVVPKRQVPKPVEDRVCRILSVDSWNRVSGFASRPALVVDGETLTYPRSQTQGRRACNLCCSELGKGQFPPLVRHPSPIPERNGPIREFGLFFAAGKGYVPLNPKIPGGAYSARMLILSGCRQVIVGNELRPAPE